jgi:glycoprotein 6-alpha-L-fucosyltransferase
LHESYYSVHVRRTDKLDGEASLHNLDEYMRHVEEYYDKYDLINNEQAERVVYLATDEISVLNEATNETR